MKQKLIIILLLLLSVKTYGTHNRAGEITYRQISDLTYEITITTFTYVLSLADRNALEVEWGDNTTSIAPRVELQQLPNYYQRNVYRIQHTYPGAGVYKIVVQDPNRNDGIINIPNSVNVVFSISTILLADPTIGFNNTPILLNPPYDKAALGHRFIHNPGAYDEDGDSLSYALTVCTREDGIPIENYTFPATSNVFYMDSITGDLVWDAPVKLGRYNVAIEINEWRLGYKIGSVVRDMQIDVYETDNNPPVIGPLRDFCIEAGDSIGFDVSATDEDADIMTLFATSGLFTLTSCQPEFDSISSTPGTALYNFKWLSCHERVRDQPYDILIKAEDNNSDIALFDLDNFRVKVLGPAPLLLSASPQGKFVKLTWDNYATDIVRGYNIYRRINPTSFVPDSCTNGIPEYLEFELVGFSQGFSTLSFTDTNGGAGLEDGVQYSYRIVAVYPNGAESKSSNELTTALISGIPVIVKASILETNDTNGKVYLQWLKPRQLDTIPALGPFDILVYRSEGITGDNYQLIKTFTDLNDTTLIDSLINTVDYAYIYSVELYNKESGNEGFIGDPGVASTPYMTLSPGDRKVNISISINVPWINTDYVIYRYNDLTFNYDSAGSTNLLSFVDDGLVNGQNYCYYISSIGEYMSPVLPDSIVNFSQEACIIPYDNEPPCTPYLQVSTNCDELYNDLIWSLESSVCYDDVKGYNIYYKGDFGANLALIDSVTVSDTLHYRHDDLPGDIVAGCYAVSAYDRNGNESPLSATICVDSCNFYEIPNVFTPNGDGKNDLLIAKTSGLIEKVNFILYNRTGIEVFRTSEPRLNWNGTYKGSLVGPGVYFYQCDVFERRITGLEQFHLSGFIHVITVKGAKPVIIEY
jgi:gliding motility-associated-like protein